MTPEERVEKIFDVPESEMCSDVIPLELEQRIAQAIREAVREVRNERWIEAEHILRQIREAKIEAYEEAASVAANWGSADDEPTDPDVAFGCLAAAISALKRPLSEAAGRGHLHQIRILEGGHAWKEEHGCTRACQLPAETPEYICILHGQSVYGDEGCPSCLRLLKDSLVSETVSSQ
jgi:hypothetical protein